MLRGTTKLRKLNRIVLIAVEALQRSKFQRSISLPVTSCIMTSRSTTSQAELLREGDVRLGRSGDEILGPLRLKLTFTTTTTTTNPINTLCRLTAPHVQDGLEVGDR